MDDITRVVGSLAFYAPLQVHCISTLNAFISFSLWSLGHFKRYSLNSSIFRKFSYGTSEGLLVPYERVMYVRPVVFFHSHTERNHILLVPYERFMYVRPVVFYSDAFHFSSLFITKQRRAIKEKQYKKRRRMCDEIAVIREGIIAGHAAIDKNDNYLMALCCLEYPLDEPRGSCYEKLIVRSMKEREEILNKLSRLYIQYYALYGPCEPRLLRPWLFK